MAVQRADPERIGTRADFARELTVLRAEAGLTVRDVAKRVGAPAATLGDYFAGRHLPGPRQVPLYLAILDACGVREPAEVEPWTAALTRIRLVSDGRAAKVGVPFRGLEPFAEADAGLYFGRQAVVQSLLERLGRMRRDGGGLRGAAAVVGPSGSGKTSLFMAGLLPAVRRGALGGGQDCDVVVLTGDQLASCASVPALRPHPQRLVVVDQLEAIFGVDRERRRMLLAWLAAQHERSLVVYGLRADFYHAAVAEPALVPALRNQLILGPMTAGELREAILGPAREVGAGVEDGLVDLILADLAPRSAPEHGHEPGALPLLSYALLATWERAPHNHLAIADYREVGGLNGAVGSAAEAVYGDLSEAERIEARRLFARLVRVEDGGPPTRRRVGRGELGGDPGLNGSALPAVLERFVRARLLTADAQTIQISHEALLGAWPRLSEWVDSDRDWLRMHQEVADAAQRWTDSDRDEALLLRGARLEAALELAAAPGRQQELNRVESDFLSASADHRDGLEQARRRRARRTAQLLGAVAVLAVVAVALSAVAVDADLGADRARDQALSRQVAIEAQQLQPTDPSLAAQLALAAYRISPTTQATSTLLDATAGEIPARLLGPVGPEFVSVSDRGLLAVAQSAADTVRLYQLAPKVGDPVRLAQVRVGASAAQDYAVAVSADGRLLAAGGTTDTVVLWNVANPRRPVRLATMGGLGSTVYSLAFTLQDREIAAGDANGTVVEWNVANPSRPTGRVVLAAPGGTEVKSVAFNRTGTVLAAAGNAGLLALWRAGATHPLAATGAAATDFESVAFGPATRLVTSSGNNDTVETWSVSTTGHLQPAHAPVTVATAEVNTAVFSPNGSIVAEGASDGSLRLYSTRTWAPLAVFGTPDPVTSLQFTADGRDLVSADSGGVTRIWRLPAPSTDTEPGNVYSLTYTSTGRYLAAGSAGANGDATIWSGAQTVHPTRVSDIEMPAGFGPAAGAAAISPDGRWLAVADATAAIQLFDTADPRHPEPVGTPLHGNKPYIEQLFFSPNGKLLLAGDDSGQIRVWNVADPRDPRVLPAIRADGKIQGIAFSPDSKILATASTDKLVRIYDIAHPERPTLLATVGGFRSYAYTVAITPDGRTLVAGSADGTIRLWDIADPSRPRLLAKPLAIPTGYVFQLSISPDGRTLAAASTASGVWLWNIATPSRPQLIGNLAAAQDAVFIVVFSPNDRVLAASGSDNTLHLWDYRPEQAAQAICSAVGASMTRAEWGQYIQGASYRPPCG